MGLSIDAYTQPYAAYAVQAGSYASSPISVVSNVDSVDKAKSSEKAVAESGATIDISDAGKKALETTAGSGDKVVIQDESVVSKIADKTSKMTDTQRSDLVSRMKADDAARQSQLMNVVQKMFSHQANTYSQSSDIWRFLAGRNYTVDAATKIQAQDDVSEDGYYGVKQTSERMFEFAMSLSGGDVNKMKSMQEAVQKGYNQAEETWGGNLPEISKKTLDATNKLFEEYFASQEKAAQEKAAQQSTQASSTQAAEQANQERAAAAVYQVNPIGQ